MRVLLTGAAGFIGSSLAERLVARGDLVTGVDAFDETLYPAVSHRRNLTRLLENPRFRLVEGDVTDAGTVAALAADRPDVVVHLAALAGVRPSFELAPRYERVNAGGTRNVLDAMRAHGVTRLVHASTSSVYDANVAASDRPVREDDRCDQPLSPYAATKRAAELLCAEHGAGDALSIACLRLFSVYGPRQRPDMVIHRWTELLEADRPITLFGDGTTARDYTFVEDVVEAFLAAIDWTATPRGMRIFNVGASRPVRLDRLVDVLAQTLGRTPTIVHKPLQPGDVPLSFADVTRARSELGYAPRVRLEEGVERFVEWWRRR